VKGSNSAGMAKATVTSVDQKAKDKVGGGRGGGDRRCIVTGSGVDSLWTMAAHEMACSKGLLTRSLCTLVHAMSCYYPGRSLL
jgi:hypothetical protein